jgi:serine/threonine protein kinase
LTGTRHGGFIDALIEAGTVLAGRYRLEEPIGEGGMGTVWRAHHLGLDSPVAIKLVRDKALSGDDTLSRFLREARASAKLRSPHVVQVFDSGIADGVPFIAMELLEGESLKDRLTREQRLDPAAAWSVLQPIGWALERAHEAGIVHRDLKPGNVQLVPDGEREVVKVLDFGIAKLAANLDEDAETATGALMGTPFYMSPEQLADSKRVDTRADVWAIAVLAYEILVGRRPFGGKTIGALVMAVCNRDRPVPSDEATVPSGFDAWFSKACARELDDRFGDIKQAMTALEQALATEPSADPALEETQTVGMLAEADHAIATADTVASLDGDQATQAATNDPTTLPRPEPAAAAPFRVRGPMWQRMTWPLLGLIAVGLIWAKTNESPPPPRVPAVPAATTTGVVASSRTVASTLKTSAAPAPGFAAVPCDALDPDASPACGREGYTAWCDEAGDEIACCSEGLAAIDASGACGCPPGGSKQASAIANGCAEAGDYDMQKIQGAIQVRKKALRSCYEKALERNPKIGGKVTFRFVIDGHGRLFQLRIGDSSLPDPVAQKCFLGALSDMTLPPPAGGSLTVAYPMTFSAD